MGPATPTLTTTVSSSVNSIWPPKSLPPEAKGCTKGTSCAQSQDLSSSGTGEENQTEGSENILASLPGEALDTSRRKFPLQRKPSNLTSDSGRSSTSATDEIPDCVFHDELDTLRRHSLSCTDASGHLNVPGLLDDHQGDPLTNSAARPQASEVRTSASFNVLSTGDKSDFPGVHVKRAPKIVYSHSEDRLTTQISNHRPIIPALPYSPYASPCASPRLQRQPTMETHRVSVSDADGYTQLNQYRLKDEIGKVSMQLI